MTYLKSLLLVLCLVGLVAQGAIAQVVLIGGPGGSTNNGNLDLTARDEAAPGFFLPKPIVWVYEGTRTNTGPYGDGLSSEPWAGPAPTPVTTDGLLNLPFPDGCGGADCGVFFKPFTGNLGQNNLATAHLSQTHPANPGWDYTFTGWAGAEPNYSGLVPGGPTRTEMALEFYNGPILVGSSVLDLAAAGLGSGTGNPFGYRQFSLTATAPATAASVRARVSMIDAYGTTGGQAFVVDDFTLTAVPEPSSFAAFLLGLLGVLRFARTR